METFVQHLAWMGPVGLFVILALTHVLGWIRAYIQRVKDQKAQQVTSVPAEATASPQIAAIMQSLQMPPTPAKSAEQSLCAGVIQRNAEAERMVQNQRLAVQKAIQDSVDAIAQGNPNSIELTLKLDSTVETGVLPRHLSSEDVSIINEHPISSYEEQKGGRHLSRRADGSTVRANGCIASPMTKEELDSKINENILHMTKINQESQKAIVEALYDMTPTLTEKIKALLPKHKQAHQSEAISRGITLEQVEQEFVLEALRFIRDTLVVDILTSDSMFATLTPARIQSSSVLVH